MIYESPDKGKTVYAREFRADPSSRKLIKTADDCIEWWPHDCKVEKQRFYVAHDENCNWCGLYKNGTTWSEN
jgi:hypothetical protein